MKTGQHQVETCAEFFSRALREARGDRSQAEFARLIGVKSQATYQRYEKGRVPTGPILHQIATRLGMSMEALIGPPQGQTTDGDAAYLISRERLPPSYGARVERWDASTMGDDDPILVIFRAGLEHSSVASLRKALHSLMQSTTASDAHKARMGAIISKVLQEKEAKGDGQ